MNFFRRFLQKLTSCTTEKRDEKPKKENLRLNRDSLYTNQPGPITRLVTKTFQIFSM